MKYIGASKIQGNGLFVGAPVSRGTTIVDYRYIKDWYLLDVSQLTDYQINHNWIIMIDDKVCETTDIIHDLNYMNHSRNPNANWHIKEKYITAARDIEAGEELTIDYRLEERSNRTKFPDWI